MDKTININLGGTLFQIDEEAYKILRDYLQSLDMKFRHIPGGNETIEDIESRIAEIFQSQKGTAGIISIENVVDMIRIIGKPEDFDLSGSETSSHDAGYHRSSTRKKMFRNPENKIISGVCGGIGAYINTDPVWIRILFIVFACFFGIGLFFYLALWLAIPLAEGDNQRREMYGSMHNMARPDYSDNSASSRIGNAFDATFRALGKVLFIIVRIFLIIFGVFIVLTGFLLLLSFVMVTVFHYPGAFSTDAVGVTISYLPDFLDYIISHNLVPWVKGLIALVVAIPLLALIYGGVRLIFWFRARDGYIWLAALVLWVMSAAALSIMLFNEGIGFAEKGRSIHKEYFRETPDTLFIRSGIKIEDIKVDKQIVLPHEESDVFYINDEKKEIYFRTNLNIELSEDKSTRYDVRKSSAGRSRMDAEKKAERLIYNSYILKNTLYMDEFFTIPSGSKWSFDYVSVTVYVPAGTIIYMDKTVEKLYHSYYDHSYEDDSAKRYWKMTEDGPEYIDSYQDKN